MLQRRSQIAIRSVLSGFSSQSPGILLRGMQTPLCYPQGSCQKFNLVQRQHNILFELIDAKRVDALVVWSSGLDAIIGAEGMQRFCQQYHPIPIVTVERTIE